MRKLFALLAVGAVSLLGAGTAFAGAMTASSFGFQIGTLPALSFAGSGTTGTATSNTLATIDPGTTITGTVTTPVTDPAAVPITAIQAKLTKNAAGSFADSGGGVLTGSAEFNGVANVKGFGGLTLLGVPLSVGSGKTSTAGAYGINITAISGTWTTGSVAISVPGEPVVTITGSNGLVGGAGTVTLVAPVTVLSNLSGGTNFAAFATLVLTYAPEPGTLLLLGSGVAGLAILGRRRLG